MTHTNVIWKTTWVQLTLEDIPEVTLQVNNQDIPIGAVVRQQALNLWINRVVSAPRACANAMPEGRLAIFADGGVMRLWVIPKGSVAILGSELATDEHKPSIVPIISSMAMDSDALGEQRCRPFKSRNQAASGSFFR